MYGITCLWLIITINNKQCLPLWTVFKYNKQCSPLWIVFKYNKQCSPLWIVFKYNKQCSPLWIVFSMNQSISSVKKKYWFENGRFYAPLPRNIWNVTLQFLGMHRIKNKERLVKSRDAAGWVLLMSFTVN